MDTQSTPVHVRLWNKDFWRIAISSFLLAVVAYMLIPLVAGEQSEYTGTLCALLFPAGMIAVGGLHTFLIQRYRRARICMEAIMVFLLGVAGFVLSLPTCSYILHAWEIPETVQQPLGYLSCFLAGAGFGMAQMTMLSTLIVDATESFYRTEANHSATWFYRLALPVGPMLVQVLTTFVGIETSLITMLSCCVVALILVASVSFPFRTPEESLKLFSLDRFFLPTSWPLSLNLLLTSLSVGVVLSLCPDVHYFAWMAVGLLCAMLSLRFVFRDSDLRSEIITGSALLFFSSLLALTRSDVPVAQILIPLLFAFGLALCGSRMLLFYIKLSRHCQRGTSQSTYIIVWETGLWLGLALGSYLTFITDRNTIILSAMAAVVASLVLYVTYTHNWYMLNKNR